MMGFYMLNKNLNLIVSDDAAYLYLPDHPGEGKQACVTKQISLGSIINNYKGPDIYLDFDKSGVLIGIELLLDE